MNEILIAGDLLPTDKNMTLFEQGDTARLFGSREEYQRSRKTIHYSDRRQADWFVFLCGK